MSTARRTSFPLTAGRWAAALAVAATLAAGCGDDGPDDPDPGAPGSQSEIDGSETGTDSESTSTSLSQESSGGTTQGGTEGNQIPPGGLTPEADPSHR
jgi:hypothetical protein